MYVRQTTETSRPTVTIFELTKKCTSDKPSKNMKEVISSVVVLGLGLGLEGQGLGLGLGLGLEQKSLALINQVLGLARPCKARVS